MAKKKTHEELIKQINVKTEFADKWYKKMRADRYGMTFCCPLELDSITLDNTLCEWDFSKVSKLPEDYYKEIIQDPNWESGSCPEPSVWNPQTERCEDYIDATYTPGSGEVTITPAEWGGVNSLQFQPTGGGKVIGQDCPIIGDSVVLPGGGVGVGTMTNPAFLGSTNANGWYADGCQCAQDGCCEDCVYHWMIDYDATDTGAYFDPSWPGVNNVGFVNALAIEPNGGGWPGGSTYYHRQVIQTNAPKTVHVLLAGNTGFGLNVNGVDWFTPTTIFQDQWQGLRMNLNDPPFPTALSRCCHHVVRAGQASNPDNPWSRVPWSRAWIFPVDLPAGCNSIVISGGLVQGGGAGFISFAIFDNTLAEMHASTQRSDLTEIVASDTLGPYPSADVGMFTGDPNVYGQYGCIGGATLLQDGNDCPMCMLDTTIPESWSCPPPYELVTLSETGPYQCFNDMGTTSPCDTETLLITVTNQNGEVMPNYTIIFDGGTYVTDENGYLEIVVEDASVNTSHTFNLCECFVTSGGCAIQKIDITVTDPDATVCETVEPLCECIPPSFHAEIWREPIMSLLFTDANYGAGNAITAISYTLEWRPEGTTAWTSVPGLISNNVGMIGYGIDLGVYNTDPNDVDFGNLIDILYGTYEYRIKAICEDSESNWSAINEFTVTATPVEPVDGCMDPLAANYNPLATIQVGVKCEYFGCTDPLALNYGGSGNLNGIFPYATIDDGSCQYPPNPVYGCTDPAASNFNAAATVDDGSCTYLQPVSGCTDPTACNYDVNAVVDDGSCCGTPTSGEVLGKPEKKVYALDGVAVDEFKGADISMNGSGEKMYVGSPRNAGSSVKPSVTEYMYNSTSNEWAAVSTIVGSQFSQNSLFGSTIESDYTNDRVIIGAYYHNAGTGNGRGGAAVYERLGGGGFGQMGADFIGAVDGGRAGWSVAIVTDPSMNNPIVAIGAPREGGVTEGRVRCFRWNGSAWAAQGQTIVGGSQHLLGSSVALNGVGSILAMGVPGDTQTGRVRVYAWNGSSSQWDIMGSAIAPSQAGQAGGNWANMGTSVRLSSSGNRVFVGAHATTYAGNLNAGAIFVYDWNVGTSQWDLVGNPIYGDISDGHLGGKVAVDQLGIRVATAVSGPNGKGELRQYKFDGSDWVLEKSGLMSDPGITDGFGDYYGVVGGIDIDADGSHIGGGAVYYDVPPYAGNPGLSNAGQVIVYGPGWTSPPCPGCTDPAATNYNPCAGTDDGSCTY